MGTAQTGRQAHLPQPQIRRRLAELGKWFHNIDLNGIQTAPDHFLGDFPSIKWSRLRDAIPADLKGKSVLDIGCNGGFYSLEMKRRGAERVLGIDADPDYLAQARFAAEVYNLDIEFREMSVYNVACLKERFDLVLFMGVLYHLRHPLLALDLLSEHVVKDSMVFQTLTRGTDEVLIPDENYPFEETEIFDNPEYPVLYFVEKSYSNDPTNWWIPNRACAEAMLRSAGFTVVSRPDHDIFICKRVDAPSRE